MSEQRIALVTGGTGFVGSNLVRRLMSEGWETHIIVRKGSDLSILSGVEKIIHVHLHDGSTERLFEIVKVVSPQVVFHLASLFLAQHTSQDIERLIHSNLLFSTQLAEAMSANGVRSLVNTGTSWQHYENKDYSPVCLYAATKQAFESILEYYIEAKCLKVITLKLFDTYGPNDPRPKLFHLLEKLSKTKEPLSMSPGEQLIDIVHVEDVINTYLIAAERLLTDQVGNHELYAVSSGNPISLKELASVYENVTNTKLPIQWGGRPYRDREVMETWTNGEIMPGWKPTITLDAGIKQMVRQSYSK